MKASFTLIAFLAFGLSTQPIAQEIGHPRGQHPAVIVKRLEARATYDYQAKFYPHPAWLYLQAEAPRTLLEHPAVIVARRARQAAQEETALAPRHVIDASIH